MILRWRHFEVLVDGDFTKWGHNAAGSMLNFQHKGVWYVLQIARPWMKQLVQKKGTWVQIIAYRYGTHRGEVLCEVEVNTKTPCVGIKTLKRMLPILEEALMVADLERRL